MAIVFGSEDAKKVLEADKERLKQDEEAKRQSNQKWVRCTTCQGDGLHKHCKGEGCEECDYDGDCLDCEGQGRHEMEYNNGEWWYVYDQGGWQMMKLCTCPHPFPYRDGARVRCSKCWCLYSDAREAQRIANLATWVIRDYAQGVDVERISRELGLSVERVQAIVTKG